MGKMDYLMNAVGKIVYPTNFDNNFTSFFCFVLFCGCIGSSLLRAGFLQLQRAVATLHCGAQTSHCGGFSCCSTQAPGRAGFSSCGTQAQQLWLMGSRAQAQQLWCTGLVAPWHVRSSQTRARTHVSCIGRQSLNHCATRETPTSIFKKVNLIWIKGLSVKC